MSGGGGAAKSIGRKEKEKEKGGKKGMKISFPFLLPLLFSGSSPPSTQSLLFFRLPPPFRPLSLSRSLPFPLL